MSIEERKLFQWRHALDCVRLSLPSQKLGHTGLKIEFNMNKELLISVKTIERKNESASDELLWGQCICLFV